jgi:hypothetical protein
MKIYYAEYFGGRVRSGWLTRESLRKIAQATKDYDTQNTSDPEYLWQSLMQKPTDTLYLTHEMFADCKSPPRQCAAILKSCDSMCGNWGKFYEEGSVAFGLSRELAREKLKKIELRFMANNWD